MSAWISLKDHGPPEKWCLCWVTYCDGHRQRLIQESSFEPKYREPRHDCLGLFSLRVPILAYIIQPEPYRGL